jgi:hypothetical protein
MMVALSKVVKIYSLSARRRNESPGAGEVFFSSPATLDGRAGVPCEPKVVKMYPFHACDAKNVDTILKLLFGERSSCMMVKS